MGFYDKQIQYLDLWEYGEKIGNAGFVKIDVRDAECKVWISVKGICLSDVLVARLLLLDDEGERLADQMLLHQGMGTYAANWETDNLAQTGMEYLKWEGIRIEISTQRYIEKRWTKIPVTEEEIIKPLPEKVEEVPAKKTEETAVESKTEAVEKKDDMHLNKWSMLGQYYKKKVPFEDKKEYLCISPEDLILLPEKYEHLYKNSFLLHGYYAYGHLLLGAISVQDRNIYRLYIPGLGHAKEQIVANMFGFGNFIPVDGLQPGNGVSDRLGRMQGYYYMTVEL